MEYPMSTIMNKTKYDILLYSKHLAQERNIPPDLLLFTLDSVRNDVANDVLSFQSNKEIEYLNKIDELSKEQQVDDLK